MCKIVKFGDVVKYDKQNGQGSLLPYVGMENISSESMQVIGVIEVPEKTSTTFKFNTSHVLFGRLRPYLRKLLVPEFEGQCSTEIFCLKPCSDVDRQYLAYWLLSPIISSRIDKTSTGARMPRANMNALLEFEFLLPSLAEQQRIAAKLDAAFVEIDKAISSAVHSVKNADALYEATIEILFNNELYDKLTLNDVCMIVGGSQPPKSDFEYEPTNDNIRLIQIRDYKSDKHIVYINKEKAKRFCSADDIMIGRYGPPIFQILKGIKGAYNVALMKAVPKDNIEINYLYYFLKNRKIQQYVINQSVRAAGQSGVNKNALSPYPIFLPSKKEQIEIIEISEKLEMRCSELNNLFQSKLNNLYALKSSILAQEIKVR